MIASSSSKLHRCETAPQVVKNHAFYLVDNVIAHNPRALSVPWLRFLASPSFRNLLHETVHETQRDVEASRLHDDMRNVRVVLPPHDLQEKSRAYIALKVFVYAAIIYCRIGRMSLPCRRAPSHSPRLDIPNKLYDAPYRT